MALDLGRPGRTCAVSEHVRPDHPVIPESARAACDGTGAVRAPFQIAQLLALVIFGAIGAAVVARFRIAKPGLVEPQLRIGSRLRPERAPAPTNRSPSANSSLPVADAIAARCPEITTLSTRPGFRPPRPTVIPPASAHFLKNQVAPFAKATVFRARSSWENCFASTAEGNERGSNGGRAGTGTQND